MISVTRMNGSRFYINAEMILSVEATPDTVITLVNDRKLIVRDKAEEVVAYMMAYQQKIRQPFMPDAPSKKTLPGE